MPNAWATPNPQVRCAILAGGQARRMAGAPKGLTLVGGVRILDRLVDAAVAAFGEPPVLISASPDAPTWHPGLRVVADRTPGGGALSGLETAIQDAPAPVVVVAWDLPFVTAPLLRRLGTGLDQADVVIPASDGPGGVEPLCAGYGPGCLGPIREALARGELRATGWHHQVRVEVIPGDEVRRFGDPARLFFNLNTPADVLVAEGWARA